MGKERTAKEFMNIVAPKHCRTSCSDNNVCNGFYTRNCDGSFYGRCTRCMYIEIISGCEIPKDLDPEYLDG